MEVFYVTESCFCISALFCRFSCVGCRNRRAARRCGRGVRKNRGPQAGDPGEKGSDGVGYRPDSLRPGGAAGPERGEDRREYARAVCEDAQVARPGEGRASDFPHRVGDFDPDRRRAGLRHPAADLVQRRAEAQNALAVYRCAFGAADSYGGFGRDFPVPAAGAAFAAGALSARCAAFLHLADAAGRPGPDFSSSRSSTSKCAPSQSGRTTISTH